MCDWYHAHMHLAKQQRFCQCAVVTSIMHVKNWELNFVYGNDQAGKDDLLQTQTANSLEWALKEPSLDCEESFIPSFAERVSFSALQNMSGNQSRGPLLHLHNSTRGCSLTQLYKCVDLGFALFLKVILLKRDQDVAFLYAHYITFIYFCNYN